MENLRLVVFFLLSFQVFNPLYCQKSEQFILCNIDTRFYTFDRNCTIRRQDKELKNYTADYSDRFNLVISSIMKEDEFHFVKNIPVVESSDQDKMDTISGYLYEEWMNLMRSGNYSEKKSKKIKPAPDQILEFLKYFGEKYETDHLGFITIDGFVKEKPDKMGQFDKNAKGYIYFRCYDIDVKTGRILFEFWEPHPRASVVSSSYSSNQQKLDVLTNKIIEIMSEKYLSAFAKKWQARKVPKWKIAVQK